MKKCIYILEENFNRPTVNISRTNTKKRCPIHQRGLEWKVGSQEIPGVISTLGLRVQNEAGQRLTVFSREWTCHSKHPLPAAQEMTLHMDITWWSIIK